MKRLAGGGLWRHRDFLNLWSAETISQFGSQVSRARAAARRDPRARGERVRGRAARRDRVRCPFILFSLPAGVWVDRLRRKPILSPATSAARALLASIPLAYCARRADDLAALRRRLPRRRAAPSSSTSRTSRTCPRSSTRDQLVEGNSKLEISRSAAQLAGPGLGGVPRRADHRPVAVLVDAISFLASALFLFCGSGSRGASRRRAPSARRGPA